MPPMPECSRANWPMRLKICRKISATSLLRTKLTGVGLRTWRRKYAASRKRYAVMQLRERLEEIYREFMEG